MMRPGGAPGVPWKVGVLVFGALLVALFGGGSSARASVRIDPSLTQQALRYWTPARMRAAKPMEGSPPSLHLSRGAEPDGRPGAVMATAATASGVTFDEVAYPTSEELRRNGVVFFLVDGIPARCSGTSVNAPNRSVVFTAGHCVFNRFSNHHWYDRLWVFVPGFRFGQRPFGVFPATHLDATKLWMSEESEDADVGAAVVGRNERGQSLEAAVGGDGIAWNQPARQVFDVHGYPAGPPFDGETQRLCSQTPFLAHDALSYLMKGPLNLAVSCNVTGGASGGGWTIGGDTLNSVTDYAYPRDPATDYGSYFGQEVARLYGRVARLR
ncbi:MAG: trypsin-like serine peptidase [Solirubrobacterales bacterium]